mmetsp:Transcript_11996/g.28454  ORF Transcript_11996/g.28454 Transcript_11996/m.28454 type:complete len:237 (+) Transcript_11996:280-990(+)
MLRDGSPGGHAIESHLRDFRKIRFRSLCSHLHHRCFETLPGDHRPHQQRSGSIGSLEGAPQKGETDLDGNHGTHAELRAPRERRRQGATLRAVVQGQPDQSVPDSPPSGNRRRPHGLLPVAGGEKAPDGRRRAPLVLPGNADGSDRARDAPDHPGGELLSGTGRLLPPEDRRSQQGHRLLADAPLLHHRLDGIHPGQPRDRLLQEATDHIVSSAGATLHTRDRKSSARIRVGNTSS